MANPDCFDLTYRPKEPISQHFGGIIGDAVNNMRESLDYWTTAVFSARGEDGKKPNFPFEGEGKDLETNPQYLAIKKTFPDLANFILKEVKPRKRDNFDLWAVTSLCNGNKHNDFLPVVSFTTINNINAKIGSNTIKDCSVACNADSPHKLIRAHMPITIENKFSTSVEIKFPKGAVFEDQPVIPTLLNLSQVTTKTLDALDRFIEPYIK
ncbi:MAG: hypothetical protein FD139_2388 [Methylocystaceae bacterium]|nr:MAG: hypothetical protein FD172_370 [Methylocystaceae bacterium]TXT44210.1 MAG: hypothetical protein FD139_2388 [Methylocystaceae bacterium]